MHKISQNTLEKYNSIIKQYKGDRKTVFKAVIEHAESIPTERWKQVHNITKNNIRTAPFYTPKVRSAHVNEIVKTATGEYKGYMEVILSEFILWHNTQGIDLTEETDLKFQTPEDRLNEELARINRFIGLVPSKIKFLENSLNYASKSQEEEIKEKIRKLKLLL